jgi:hypothetical protein
MQRCTICNEWYAGVGIGRLETCEGCLPNFAGNPLEEPSAREALNAYVDAHCPSPLTPRQTQALARLAAVWRRQDADGTP